MPTTRRSSSRAGRLAKRRFDRLAHAWRRRVMRPVFLLCGVIFLAFTVAGLLADGLAKFYFGVAAGATGALYMAFRDAPPAHIEKWRTGSEGEHRTANAVRRLVGAGWRVWHDIPRANGTNIDHVVVGAAGVFLLDTKNFEGEARVEDGELRIRWLEDPDDGWVCHGIAARMRGASAELKDEIEAATGVRVWVQPVVVVWQRFPQRVAELSDRSSVYFVHGDALTGWLLGRGSVSSFDTEKVAEFVDGMV